MYRYRSVVVWCRKEELYNLKPFDIQKARLWFDVEKKNYTTEAKERLRVIRLWFDVEKKNYTTITGIAEFHAVLWFDVEKKNYTT